MSYNPNKHDPKKITLTGDSIKLSEKQLSRIKYEASLLRQNPQKPLTLEQMMTIAPFLFFENVTAANTEVKEEESEDDIIDDDIEPFWMDNYMSFD
jgi:hypothetical protein